MQALGALMGSVVMAYFLLALMELRNQSRQSSLRTELMVELLCQKIDAAARTKPEVSQHQSHWQGSRRFVVHRKVKETADTFSFYLSPQDRKPLKPFKPGQFLTLRQTVPGESRPVVRCYTISNGPNQDCLRITVKRVPNGTASVSLHDNLQAGATLDVAAPSGHFCIEPDDSRPLVLIAGGVGITPFSSMLQTIADKNPQREVVLFYAVRNGREHILKSEIESIEKRSHNIRVITLYSSPDEHDLPLRDFDLSGRLSLEVIQGVLPSLNYDFYICGPSSLMNTMKSELLTAGVPESDVYTEGFGAPLTPNESHATTGNCRDTVQLQGDTVVFEDSAKKSPEELKVEFGKSGLSDTWDGSEDNLLSFAARNGVKIIAGCGTGNCGSCKTSIRTGAVKYRNPPCFNCEDGTCLPCVAVPDEDLVLDV